MELPKGDLRELTRALDEAPSLGESHESICDAVPTAIVIVNADGVIVLVNREAEYLTFYNRGELLGSKVEVLVPESKRSIHSEHHRPEYMQHPRRREMARGMDLSIRRKDGTEIPVEIQLEHVIRPEGRLTVTAILPKARHGSVDAT